MNNEQRVVHSGMVNGEEKKVLADSMISDAEPNHTFSRFSPVASIDLVLPNGRGACLLACL